MEETTDAKPPFAAWLRRQLMRRGWIAAELARRMDVPSGTVSRWMSGTRVPRDPAHIRLMAEVLGVHQDEILEQLDMRDGGADRMSLAVRRLAPVIDSYEWDDEKLETAERMIRSIGELYRGRLPAQAVEE